MTHLEVSLVFLDVVLIYVKKQSVEESSNTEYYKKARPKIFVCVCLLFLGVPIEFHGETNTSL